jgi:hypothetical protein
MAGAVAGAAPELAGAAAGLDGVAALLVWANAEIAKRAATARVRRKNLLVIGSVELLGTWFRGMNFRDRSQKCFVKSTLGRN